MNIEHVSFFIEVRRFARRMDFVPFGFFRLAENRGNAEENGWKIARELTNHRDTEAQRRPDKTEAARALEARGTR